MSALKTVREVMSSDVTTLDVNDNLSIADDVMNLGRIRHMPVLDEDGGLAGIVSQRDIYRGALSRLLGYGERAQSKLIATLSVKDVMTTNPRTMGPDALLSDAAQMIYENKLGCLVVVEEGRVVGILTESDFVHLATPKGT
ncbi:MAG: CBS domain-containing protein [Myxococcota bacterium]|jgi:CBS domain-containing protein|nr:CBS domain-containing protein [Myxococcota bacterium]